MLPVFETRLVVAADLLRSAAVTSGFTVVCGVDFAL